MAKLVMCNYAWHMSQHVPNIYIYTIQNKLASNCCSAHMETARFGEVSIHIPTGSGYHGNSYETYFWILVFLGADMGHKQHANPNNS